jgi:hypothetical protein
MEQKFKDKKFNYKGACDKFEIIIPILFHVLGIAAFITFIIVADNINTPTKPSINK